MLVVYARPFINQPSQRTTLTFVLFFVFFILFVLAPRRHTAGLLAYPLLPAAEQSIRVRWLQFVVVVALVECHQKDVVIFSPSVKEPGGSQTKCHPRINRSDWRKMHSINCS